MCVTIFDKLLCARTRTIYYFWLSVLRAQFIACYTVERVTWNFATSRVTWWQVDDTKMCTFGVNSSLFIKEPLYFVLPTMHHAHYDCGTAKVELKLAIVMHCAVNNFLVCLRMFIMMLIDDIHMVNSMPHFQNEFEAKTLLCGSRLCK